MLNKLTKIKRLLLIGKEIWHNKRSMRGRFIIYLLSLVLLAGSAGRFCYADPVKRYRHSTAAKP